MSDPNATLVDMLAVQVKLEAATIVQFVESKDTNPIILFMAMVSVAGGMANQMIGATEEGPMRDARVAFMKRTAQAMLDGIGLPELVNFDDKGETHD